MLCKDISKKISKVLLDSCEEYFRKNLPDKSFPEAEDISLQITREEKHGDLTSNVAMRLGSIVKLNPKTLGDGIIEIFHEKMKDAGLSFFIRNIELKGAFINFYLSDEYYRKLLLDICLREKHFGKADGTHKERVNLEFLSANPTGPLTIAHGRQAAIGDALSKILRFNGYMVTNEYYLNDIGRQISLLGRSVEARYRDLFGDKTDLPEGGYKGEYINTIAREIRSKKGNAFIENKPSSVKFFRDYGVKYMMKLIKKDLSDFGVNFDVWSSQSVLEKSGNVEKVLKLLEKKDCVYDEGGAKWFASTRFGDDKDRVVVKSDGSYTYLAPDIAYHLDKYARGYSRLIDLLGPDHHGYIKRMKSAVQALGYDEKSLDILIVQLVSLLRDGEKVSMSTREGEFISLREILDELGKDVTRFFFLSRRLDSLLDFDIGLAKKESVDNPVFYIQYAHARICSIKKYSRKNRIQLIFQKTNLELLDSKYEKSLMRKLGEFPFVVKACAEMLEPNRLIVYLNELARSFHSFYTECRVVSSDKALSKARLFLVECVRIVLANGLRLLNITLPERM